MGLLETINPDTYQAEKDSFGSAYAVDAITPSNSADLTRPVRAIYVGGGGDIRLVTVGDDDVVFKNVPAGLILPVKAKKVFATNTTATFLLGLL